MGEADTVKKAVETEVARALRAGRIGKVDATFVREAGRGGVDKGFGTANEDPALDVYERIIGGEVSPFFFCKNLALPIKSTSNYSTHS